MPNNNVKYPTSNIVHSAGTHFFKQLQNHIRLENRKLKRLQAFLLHHIRRIKRIFSPSERYRVQKIKLWGEIFSKRKVTINGFF